VGARRAGSAAASLLAALLLLAAAPPRSAEGQVFHVYDRLNRLRATVDPTANDAAIWTYDFNGNLTNGGTKTYTWNVRDQLLSMTGASFQYDALGRRHRRVVGSTTRDFVYDGLNLVQEKQDTTVKANVVTGLGLDEVFTRIKGSATRHLLADALGSTLALTDPAGAVQTSYTYARSAPPPRPASPTRTRPSSRAARTTAPASTTTGRGTTIRGCTDSFVRIRYASLAASRTSMRM
jgi:hypothetical protein